MSSGPRPVVKRSEDDPPEAPVFDRASSDRALSATCGSLFDELSGILADMEHGRQSSFATLAAVASGDPWKPQAVKDRRAGRRDRYRARASWLQGSKEFGQAFAELAETALDHATAAERTRQSLSRVSLLTRQSDELRRQQMRLGLLTGTLGSRLDAFERASGGIEKGRAALERIRVQFGTTGIVEHIHHALGFTHIAVQARRPARRSREPRLTAVADGPLCLRVRHEARGPAALYFGRTVWPDDEPQLRLAFDVPRVGERAGQLHVSSPALCIWDEAAGSGTVVHRGRLEWSLA